MESTTSNEGRTTSSRDIQNIPSEDIIIGLEAMNVDHDVIKPIKRAPSSPTREGHDAHRPFRDRFGASMTIIAATSPEIKALNLPFTPNFPSYLESSRRSLDLSPSSMIPQPSMTRARSMRERVSFFIDQMDDVEDIPSFASPPPQHKSTCSLYCNEHEDDLLRSLHSPTIMTHHAHRNKENIHPNSMLQTPNKNTLMVGSRCEDPSLVQKSSCHTRRKSFHRRDSTRSLPSPAEIGASPIACDSETPRHKNASICPIAFPSGSDGVKELSTSDCRSNMQPSICMAPKSLHLSTGFR